MTNEVTVAIVLVRHWWQLTLQATRWGQSFPKPSGGEILRSSATTSRCFMRPLRQHSRTTVNHHSTVKVIRSSEGDWQYSA